MVVAVLPHGIPSNICTNLARLSLSSANVIGGEYEGDTKNGKLGDLAADDHLVMMVSSKALLADLRCLRCQVSIVAVEPPAIQRRYYRLLPLLANRYQSIFTYSRTLGRLANARYIAHGGCSIPEHKPLGPKLGGVSLLSSAKRSTSGHRLRHEIASWARAQERDLRLFGRGYHPVDCISEALARFHFSVVIENSRYDGYFTEKLIDCLYCRTIPIYWGDPSITNVFDPRGLIRCSNRHEITEALRSVNEAEYLQMLPYIEANHLRARSYLSHMVTRVAKELCATA